MRYPFIPIACLLLLIALGVVSENDSYEEENLIYVKTGVIDTSIPDNFVNSLKFKRDSTEILQIIVSLKPGNVIDPVLQICSAKTSINLSAGSYVLLCPINQIIQLESHDSVKWIGKYHNYMKTEMSRTRSKQDFETYESYDVLWAHEITKEEAIELLDKVILDGQLNAFVSESYSKYSVVSVHHQDVEIFLEKVSQIEVVHRVERKHPLVLFNSKARAITHTGVIGQTLFPRGLNGDGVIIGVSDSGLDVNHCFFYDPNFDVIRCTSNTSLSDCLDTNGHRKVVGYYEHADSTDDDGHGTHVAGTAAGNTFVKSNAKMNQNQGVAPNSKIAFFDIGLGDLASLIVPSLSDLLLNYLDQKGSSLSTHSWGSSSPFYLTQALETDAFVYNHPDHLVLFAAGNDGPGRSTVSGTSISKNGISVGSALNTVDPGISDFSSRGPTLELRIKPDFVAPGDTIVSAKAGTPSEGKSCDKPDDQLSTLSGTSMATPNAAGAAALVYQYYRQGYICGRRPGRCGFNPSAALVKATLINSAQHFYYTGNVVDNIGATGYGRLQLNDTLDFSGKKLIFFDRRKLRSFERFSTTVTPTGKGSLNIVLAWTDPPPSLFSSRLLVNDLDLIVISPSGAKYFGNVYLGLPYIMDKDRFNNVERVVINTVENGPHQVIVKANNLNSFSQDFSLVINLESSVKYHVPLNKMRMSNGKSSREGRLEVEVGYQWLNVCKSKINVSAKDICEKILNFPESNQHFMYTYDVHPSGSNNFLEDVITCTGSERNLNNCQRTSYVSSMPQCDSNDIVSIYCDCPQGYTWDGETCFFEPTCESASFENFTSINTLNFPAILSVEVPQFQVFEHISVQTFFDHNETSGLSIYLFNDDFFSALSLQRGDYVSQNPFNGTIWSNWEQFSPIEYIFQPGQVATRLRPEDKFPDFWISQGKWNLAVLDFGSSSGGTIDGFILNLLTNCTQPPPFVNCGSSSFFGPLCLDFDECSLSPCPSNMMCVNTIGSYRCENLFDQLILSKNPSFYYTFDQSDLMDSSNNANDLIDRNNPLAQFPLSTNNNNKALFLAKTPAVTSKQICHSSDFTFLVSFHSKQPTTNQRLMSLSVIMPNGTETPLVSLTFSGQTIPALNLVRNRVNVGRTSNTFPVGNNYHVMLAFERTPVPKAYIVVNGVTRLNINVPTLLPDGSCFQVSMARGMTNSLLDYASFHTTSLFADAQQIHSVYQANL